MSNLEQHARIELAAAHRLCVREGLNEGTWNHLSLTHPERDDQLLVTPDRIHWKLVRAVDLLVLDACGNKVAGIHEPNGSTWIIHGPVHRARPDARCLIHVHPIHSTALFMRAGETLNTSSSQMAAAFVNRISYFDTYDGALISYDEGMRMADALGDAQILVLRNHGILVAGQTVAQTFLALYKFERACQMQLLAQFGGGRLSHIPAPVLAAIAAHEDSPEVEQAHFTGWMALLDKEEPEYRSLTIS